MDTSGASLPVPKAAFGTWSGKKEIAREILADVEKLEKKPAVAEEPRDQNGIVFSRELLNSAEFAEMARDASVGMWVTYLYLLKNYDGNEEGRVELDRINLERYFDYENPMRVRDQSRKHLVRLENYKLLTIEDRRVDADDGIPVRLNHVGGAGVSLPGVFWEEQWFKQLTPRGIASYLIFLNELPGYGQKNNKQLLGETLRKKYGVSSGPLSEAIQELRHANLLDVRYDEVAWAGGHDEASVYTLKPFYSRAELAKKFKELEEKYGKENFKKAQGYAEILAEENDAESVEVILQLMNQHTAERLDKAAEAMKLLKTDNPKRCLSYFVGTVRRIAQEEQDDNLSSKI